MEQLRRIVCLAVAAVTLGAVPASARTPANLRVDGVEMNRHVIGSSPTFCWESGGGQVNWQVQVDDDPQFVANEQGERAGVWFWDSGSRPKGPMGGVECALMRSVTRPGSLSRALDSRPHSIFWRVRVMGVDGMWSDWASSSLRMNQLPSMPGDLTVSEHTTSSFDPGPRAPSSSVGATYVVSPVGNDDAPGSLEHPFRTLTHATGFLRAGDTLLVRGGVYRESLELSQRAGHASGLPGSPISIRAYPGERPVIRGASVGRGAAIRMGPRAGLHHWVFDGLTVGGAASDTGIELYGVSSVSVTDCRLERTLPRSGTGIMVGGDSEEITIAGCSFDQPLQSMIEIGSAGRVEIRDNLFSNFNGRHAIRKRGAGSGAILIAGNRFEDGTPALAAVVLSQGASGSQIVGNIFNGVGRRGKGYGVMVYRSGEVTVENNVFYEIGGAGIRLNEMSQYGTYRNNIFVRCGTGIDFKGGVVKNSATRGAAVDYNFFYRNREDLHDGSGALEHLRHVPTGNCLGGAECDPRFTGPETGDFTLQPSSPAIDVGDPASLVPSGGGARIDVGRFEAGAGTPPYDYDSAYHVSDSTPRFTWTLLDNDNRVDGAGGDHQTRFQVQIDTVSSFDSLSGSPLFDSGVVSSADAVYTLPEAGALDPGSYYVRVRQWDSHGLRAGAWSSHNLRFEVTSVVVRGETARR